MSESRFTRHPGDGDRLALAVTFPTGRGETGFGPLATRLPGWSVHELRPELDPGTGAALTGADPYLDAFLNERDTDPPVAAVLGHCAGGPLAVRLARLLQERTGRTPRVVLLDPMSVDADVLRTEYDTAVKALGGPPDPEPPAGTATAAVTAELIDRYRVRCTDACRRLGVADTFRQQMIDRFTAYLRYLYAAADAAGGPDATVVRSGAGPDGPPDGAVRLDVSAAALLRDARLGPVVGELLGR